MLLRVHYEFLLWGTSPRSSNARYNTNLSRLLQKQIYLPCIVNWGVLNSMGCAEEIKRVLEIKVYEIAGQEEIFTSEAWRRVFDISEPIYTELFHGFYSSYEFDEVCADDKLRNKKLIKFRLGGRGHNLTLLKFARRLGLYHSAKINKEGFDVYFQRGLHSDENFNAREYWLSISREEELQLSRSLVGTIGTIWSPILRVLQKMITHQNCYANVAWLMTRWLKRMGVGSQRYNMICCGQLIIRIGKKMGLLTDEVLNSLSAPTYCRALDATTLKELIDSNGRLIAKDPTSGVPRVAMPRGPRPFMQDLYDRMSSMDIRQETIERMPAGSHISFTGMLEFSSTWLGIMKF
ncbi:hypothetical protein Tco_0016106 [Tanacetum coccineum]